MAVKLHGSEVALGDTVYSMRANTTGRVVSIGENSFAAEFRLGDTTRTFTYTGNGVLAGKEDAYWYAPIALTLGKGQTDRVRKIVELLRQILTII